MIKIVDRYNNIIKVNDIIVSKDNPKLLAQVIGIEGNKLVIDNKMLNRIDKIERQTFTTSNWIKLKQSHIISNIINN